MKYYIKCEHYSISNFALIFIFAYFLMVMRCWIGFGGVTQIMTYAFPFIMSIFTLLGKIKIKIKRRYGIYAFIVFAFNVIGMKSGSNMNAVIYHMFIPLNIFFVLSVIDKDKECVISTFIDWFGFIMMVSIPLYFISNFGYCPSVGSVMSDYGNKEVSAGLYENYIFYIKPLKLSASSNLGFPRFNGPFIEPGDLGCTAAFMLMAAKFDFKRYQKLIWVLFGLLVSMSLAGYILTFLGYLLVQFSQGKISIQRLFVVIFFVLTVYLIGTYYNGGDNVFQETILSRLQNDEEKGFSGNNRNSLIKTEYFLEMLKNPHTLWFGYDANTVAFLNESGLGAGFINKALCVGMLGMIGLILPYFYIAKTSTTRLYAWSFFVFFLFYMYQRTESTWICYVICYVYGIVINERENLISD